MVFAGEYFSFTKLVAAALIFTGVFLVNLKQPTGAVVEE
jgi:drug/metabolite transporter (DMT)-like permease